MRQLRFVGVTEDGTHLLLREALPDETPDATDHGDAGTPTAHGSAEQFLLPVDERLRVASRGDRSRLGQIEIQLESSLRPREIQARIRAGESPEDVAAAAGVAIERILRFAYPVLQEREQVVIEARRTRVRRSDTAPRLGEQIDERLAKQGVEFSTITWDAYRREDGTWWLTLRWRTPARKDRQAQWAFDLTARVTTPADDSAAELQAETPKRRPMQRVPFLPADPRETDLPPRGADEQAPSRAAASSATGTAPADPTIAPVRSLPRPADPARSDPTRNDAGRDHAGPTSVRQRRTPEAADPPLPGVSASGAAHGADLPGDLPAADTEPTGRTAAGSSADAVAALAESGTADPDVVAALPEPGPADAAAPDPAASSDRPAASGAAEPLAQGGGAAPAEPAAAEPVPAEPAAAKPRPKGRGRKAAVPSWDDIVFGSKHTDG